MGVRYQKYRSIAIPLNIGIELSQVSRYFDIFGIEPALIKAIMERLLSQYLENMLVRKDMSVDFSTCRQQHRQYISICLVVAV